MTECRRFSIRIIDKDGLEASLVGVVGNAGLADLSRSLRSLGTADAVRGLLDAGHVLDIAVAVDFEVVDFARGEVDFDMPIVAAATLSEDDVLREALGSIVVPDKIDPDDVAAREVGEAYILTLIFADVLVDNRAHTLLVDVVAVDIGELFLYETLGLGDVLLSGGIATILVLDGEVDIPAFVEGIAVVVTAINFFIVPCFNRDNIVLSRGDTAKKHHRCQYHCCSFHIVSEHFSITVV